MRRHSFILLFIAVFLAPFAHGQRHRAVGSGDTIVVGGLFSLTGEGATLGNASEAALELAARDINAEFASLDLPYRVATMACDTKLVPAEALRCTQSLHAAGADIVIGPQTSAEAG
ncbi:MAG TPA: ABC transporter substrate-binding protein, partial [Thermoanaerobaculia bacterium]|nr:ABC transporter substrate-binding protein [Thermoanaerobaculia bacterium]